MKSDVYIIYCIICLCLRYATGNFIMNGLKKETQEKLTKKHHICFHGTCG